jgi:Ser/Thr protein kinase RdoA (MazF antagonist)
MLTPADAKLVERDPDLPGLGLLLDAEALAQRLEPHLPELHDRTLVCTYLRYKPGTNCLAGYRVESAGGAAAGIGPIHVTAKAFRSTDDPKLWKGATAHGPDSDVTPRPVIIPDAAVSVRVFPDDDRLQGLGVLFSPARSRLLRKLVPHRSELSEAAPVVLRYKPERRCVLRLDCPDGRKASVRCYTPPEFASSDSHNFQSTGRLRVPQRLGRSRRHNLLLFEWIAGESLDEVISARSANAMHGVGAALAELHLQDVHHLRFRTRRDEVRELASTASALEYLCPQLARRCGRLVQTLADRLLSMPPMAHPLHGDFSTDQVLMAGDEIVVLDFDEAVFGDPATDLGSFLAQLDSQTNVGQLNADDAESIAERFLDGYRQMLPVPLERVALYRAAALLRLATHPFRTRQAQWPEQTNAIITQAEKVRAAHGSAARRPPAPVRNWRGEFEVGRGKAREVGRQRSEVNSVRRPPVFSIRSSDSECTVVDSFLIADDPNLAHFAPALDPRQVVHQFSRMLPHVFTPEAAMRLREIRVSRHKPGRRCLVEYDFDHSGPEGSAAGRTLIGKVRAKRPDLISYRIQQALFSSLFHRDAGDGVVVPEPVGLVPEWHLWLQRKVSGERATQVLETNEATQLASRIAEAIYKLHGCSSPVRRRHTLSDELSILHKRLPKITRSRREWREPIRRILDACDQLSGCLSEHATALIHRDFYPDQVLIDGHRIAFVDLDLCCAGDPALDMGNFHAHLTEQALRRFGRADAMAAVQEAFVERYAKLAGDDVRQRIEAHATLSLVRHIYISTLFPDRQHLTEALLELCAQRLKVRLKSCSIASLPS